MSSLRLFGIVVSFVILAVVLNRFRTRKFSKSDLVRGLLLSAGLFSVSINPNLVNFFTQFLAGQYSTVGRLISLIIISTVILYFLLFRVISLVNVQNDKFNQLIEALALKEYRETSDKRHFAKKILAVIPAYNEEKNIVEVLQKLPKEVLGYKVEPLVADDGSSDDTKKKVQSLGFTVISNSVNRGQGGALKLGYLVAQKEQAEIVVTLDADGQHDPNEIKKVVEPIVKGEADFVNGSRRLGKQIGGGSARKIGNVLLNIIITVLLRRKITDCTSGFRAIRTDLLSKFDLREQQFQSSEPIVEAIRNGGRLKEVPITILERQSGMSKKPQDVIYGLKWLRALFKAWWR